ncbi:MAG: oxygenase MpaB family protein [Microthrixaceae bacterium]
MTATRPDHIDAGPHTADDGLFGPDSVTWRAMAHPSTGVGAATAAMIQMLYPPVMYVVDQASTFRQKPEQRAQRTSDWGTTITYGDVAAAEKAGETLRRIHSHCTAVHPDTGESIVADEPHLLIWVNNTLTWALLRAWDAFDLGLTPAERDQFVTEQKIAARLVGLDPDDVASDVAGLEAYMTAMEPKLSMSSPCLWFKDLMAEAPKDGGFGAAAAKKLMVQAGVSLMSEHQRALYGFPWGPVRERIVLGSARLLIGDAAKKLPFDSAIGAMRDHVDTHAFGARRQRAVIVPEAA